MIRSVRGATGTQGSCRPTVSAVLIAAILWLSACALGYAADGRLKPGEQLILFPTLGHPVGQGWEIDIHGWVYEPEKRRILTALLRRAIGIDEGELRAVEKGIFKERTQFFFADNERGRTFSVMLGERTWKLETSAANGHFTTRLHLAREDLSDPAVAAVITNGTLAFKILSSGEPPRKVTGNVRLLTETGLSVISDVDDTIKISEVRDRRSLLRNTFCRPFQPVPGMAAVYQSWAKSREAQFHYVSASPWQLYVPLEAFVRTNGFPAGTFHLKNFRVKDETFLDLFRSPEQYKLAVIEAMLEHFPKRQFVLVGDSGEKDPEAYGAIARKFPGQVAGIFIREVTGEEPDAVRYKTAFSGVPEGKWRIFVNAAEIENALR